MSKQKIQLSDHFDYSRLIRFVLPCIGTMLFTSIYGIVDGLCVSNFVGKTAFAAVNLIMPVPMLVGTVGFMLGTGGSAIVGITLGEGDEDKANRYFSLFVLAAFLAGVALSVLGLFLLRPVAILMGAKGEMLDFAVRYGRVLMVSVPTFILQNMFQSFFVTAEKPTLGFWFTVGAGCTNMVLDVVLVGWLRWSVEGAAIATFISQIVGGVLPVFYFLEPPASGQNGVPRQRAQSGLHQRLLRADDQSFHVTGQHPLQLPAPPLCRRERCGGLWRHHVRGVPVCGGLRGLCRGQRSHRQLPLRCPEPC